MEGLGVDLFSKSAFQNKNDGIQDIVAVTAYDFDALQPHIPAWDSLAWNSPQMSPTLLPSWVDAFLRHRLRRTEHWCCSFAYSGERLIGVLPVIITPHRILGRNHPTLRTPYDEHTPSGDILLAPGQAAGALQALLAQIRREIPTHVCIELKRVRQSSPVMVAVEQPLAGYIMRHGLTTKGSVVRLSGPSSFGVNSISTKMRSNLKRRRKMLESRGGASFELQTGSAVEPDMLSKFMAIESSGWKGREGTAISNGPETTLFYKNIIDNFFAHGRLEWHLLRVHDRIIAIEMGLRCGHSLMIPKIAYDEAYADGSPGAILTEETIKSSILRDDVAEINYMSDEDWHRYWHMERDDYVDVYLVRDSVIARSSAFAIIMEEVIMRKHVKKIAKEILPDGIIRSLKKLRNQ